MCLNNNIESIDFGKKGILFSFYENKPLNPEKIMNLAFIKDNQITLRSDQKLFYNFKIPSSRGDISKVRFNNKVIYLTDESYNSNPLSLKFAVENFNKENQSNKYLILGDMLELGKFSKKLHKKMSNASML